MESGGGSTVLLFDMDGVLVDTRASYHRAIIDTVARYGVAVLNLRPPATGPSSAEVRALKRAGGFNNDWDATGALLRRICSRLPEAGGPAPSAAEAVAAAELHAFAAEIARRGGGPEAVEAVCGEAGREWVQGEGPLQGTNLVERIFQEIYLGAEQFRRLHGLEPRFHDGEGSMAKECAILSASGLESLARRAPLAIATGRPAAEAEIALERMGTARLFSALVTLDDVRRAELRQGAPRGALAKPHPFSLLSAVEALGGAGRLIYAGDMPDDLRAARAAGEVLRIPVQVLGLALDDAEGARLLGDLGCDRVVTTAAGALAALEEML